MEKADFNVDRVITLILGSTVFSAMNKEGCIPLVKDEKKCD
jgi:hypothetical protein